MEFDFTNKLHINLLIKREKSFPVASKYISTYFSIMGQWRYPVCFVETGCQNDYIQGLI